MASLRQLVKCEVDDPKALAKVITGLSDACPLVGEMLTGSPESGTEPAISKYYISLNLESDGLVARCSQKGSDEALYVKIEDALTFWICLENNLMAGKFTRRKIPKQSISY